MVFGIGGRQYGKIKKIQKAFKNGKNGKAAGHVSDRDLFQTGHMTVKDMDKAAQWMTAASEEGYAPAIEWINDYFFDDNALIQAES